MSLTSLTFPSLSHPRDEPPAQRRPDDPDAALLDRLRAGDERAYAELVEVHSGAMLRVARRYARSSAVAEEAVQDTWLAVVQGLHRFEGRSSVKTWIFRILTYQVQARVAREARVVPLSELLAGGAGGDLALERLMVWSRERWPGHWSGRAGWSVPPDQAALFAELVGRVHRAIAGLPDRQREVLVLRDVEGESAQEVCRRVGLEPGHQRVLLHRARAAVRAEVGPYLLQVGEGE